MWIYWFMRVIYFHYKKLTNPQVSSSIGLNWPSHWRKSLVTFWHNLYNRPKSFWHYLSYAHFYIGLEPEHDKTNQMTCSPCERLKIRLGRCPVWSVSSLWALKVTKDPNFLQADSKDNDQTGQTPRLIWVFAWHTGHLVGFVMLRLIFLT